MPALAAFPKGFFTALVEGGMSLFQWIELAAYLVVSLLLAGFGLWWVRSPGGRQAEARRGGARKDR